jgi:hypothetical protein
VKADTWDDQPTSSKNWSQSENRWAEKKSNPPTAEELFTHLPLLPDCPRLGNQPSQLKKEWQMEKLLLNGPSLRRRAMQCRHLADDMMDQEIGRKLRLIADDYEAMALNYEEPDRSPSKPIEMIEWSRQA